MTAAGLQAIPLCDPPQHPFDTILMSHSGLKVAMLYFDGHEHPHRPSVPGV